MISAFLFTHYVCTQVRSFSTRGKEASAVTTTAAATTSFIYLRYHSPSPLPPVISYHISQMPLGFLFVSSKCTYKINVSCHPYRSSTLDKYLPFPFSIALKSWAHPPLFTYATRKYTLPFKRKTAFQAHGTAVFASISSQLEQPTMLHSLGLVG